MYSKKINQLATNLNPQSTDLIPIGDAETGQLKTTTFNQLSGVSSDGVISGGIVTWTGTGLNFNISPCVYYINGIRYTSPASTKTLAAADTTYDRIDVFAVNTSGQVVVIQGTPALNPIEPEGDTETTLGLTNVTIAANATVPSGVTREVIYDENLSSPTEWARTATIIGGTYNSGDTAFANTGTKSYLVTLTAGGTRGFSGAFARPTEGTITDFKSLSFAIRLTSAVPSGTAFNIAFYNGTTIVSNQYSLSVNNTVGFNRTLTNQWQLITIPLDGSLLKFNNNKFTRFIIYIAGPGFTFRLDTLCLNSGIKNPTGGNTTSTNSFGFVNGSSGTATAAQATDTLTVVGTGLATTSATGKTLTIAVPSPIPSLTSGSVLFSDGTTIAQDNANFFWNDSTNKLGIGTNTPSVEINIIKNQNDATGIDISNTTSDSAAQARLLLTSDGSSGSANIGKYSTGTTPLKIIAAKDFTIYNGNTAGDISILNDYASGTIKLASGGSSTSQLVLKTTGQLQLNNYTSTSVFTGTAAGYLAFDSSGNIITATTPSLSMAIGGSITSATAGSVLFAGTSGVLQQDNTNFFWDDSNNRLGIGTNAPTTDIDVARGSTGAVGIQVKNTTTGSSSQAVMNLIADTNKTAQFQKMSTSFGAPVAPLLAGDFGITNYSSGDIGIINKFSTGKIKFSVNNTSVSQMTLTAAGRLLIGTTSESTYILDVNGTTRFQDNTLISKNQNAATGQTISNTTSGSASQVQILFTSSAGSANIAKYSATTTGLKIIAANDFIIYNGNAVGDIAVLNDFTTGKIKFAAGGSSTAQMTIQANGEVIVGGTTDNGAYNLQCNGTGVWGAGAYVNGSDIRLKENIKPITSGLDYVSKMNPVSFNYIESYSKNRNKQTGFIAQELKEVFKNEDWVDGIVIEDENHLNVAYQNLIPILTKAIQELKQEIEILKNK